MPLTIEEKRERSKIRMRKRRENPVLRAKDNKRSLKYYYKNREKCLRQHKKYNEKNRIKLKKKQLELRNIRRQKILDSIGNRCIVCGSMDKICFHEIHNLPHLTGYMGYPYVLAHLIDFVPVCLPCHSAYHTWLLPKFQISLEEFIRFIRSCK